MTSPPLAGVHGATSGAEFIGTAGSPGVGLNRDVAATADVSLYLSIAVATATPPSTSAAKAGRDRRVSPSPTSNAPRNEQSENITPSRRQLRSVTPRKEHPLKAAPRKSQFTKTTFSNAACTHAPRHDAFAWTAS